MRGARPAGPGVAEASDDAGRPRT